MNVNPFLGRHHACRPIRSRTHHTRTAPERPNLSNPKRRIRLNYNSMSQTSPALPYIVSKFTCSISPESEFCFAAASWMESKSIKALPGANIARYIRETTEVSYRRYIRTLELFFTGYKLGDINLSHFEAYQRARISGDQPFVRFRRPQDSKPQNKNGVEIPAKGKTPCSAKPQKINQELGLLMRLMKRAGCWSDELESFYQPLLNDEEEVLRALSPEEHRTWLETSKTKKEWNLVYWHSILAFDTCMSTDEIRGLRIGDINMFQRVITVARKTAKNSYRARTIELVGADVLWALEQLLTRARDFGATAPHHYLFPRRVSVGVYDPTRSMSVFGLNKYWYEIRKATGLTMVPAVRLPPYGHHQTCRGGSSLRRDYESGWACLREDAEALHAYLSGFAEKMV
jgi:integrase